MNWGFERKAQNPLPTYYTPPAPFDKIVSGSYTTRQSPGNVQPCTVRLVRDGSGQLFVNNSLVIKQDQPAQNWYGEQMPAAAASPYVRLLCADGVVYTLAREELQ